MRHVIKQVTPHCLYDPPPFYRAHIGQGATVVHAFGGLHGTIDVRLIGQRMLSQHLAGAGVDDIHAARTAIHPGAVDIVLPIGFHLGHSGHPLRG